MADDEEYFFLGTPLREEEESRAGQRRKEVQDPAAVRQLPLWKQARPAHAPRAAKRRCASRPHVQRSGGGRISVAPAWCHTVQEVTDEEGRRRFHGAFTGGYSAGYYNTVGSKEGWEPKAFKSSRDDRGAAKCARPAVRHRSHGLCIAPSRLAVGECETTLHREAAAQAVRVSSLLAYDVRLAVAVKRGSGSASGERGAELAAARIMRFTWPDRPRAHAPLRRQQVAEDFMDEDERAEVARHSLQARGAYDTFGSAAAAREAAREAAGAAAAAAARPGAVPALVPAELIAPVADSVGARAASRTRLAPLRWPTAPRRVHAPARAAPHRAHRSRRGGGHTFPATAWLRVRPARVLRAPRRPRAPCVLRRAGVRLLQRMGWRQGKGIGAAAPAPDDAGGGAGRKRGRWGREAGLGAENTPIYALQAKTDTHGLGFDPFQVGPRLGRRACSAGMHALACVACARASLGLHAGADAAARGWRLSEGLRKLR